MSIIDLVRSDIASFKEKREYFLESTSLPPSEKKVSFGNPPFVVAADSKYFCVLKADGSTSPLPYAYELSDEDVLVEDASAVFAWSFKGSPDGSGIAQLIPAAETLELPGKEAFAIEDPSDSDAWALVDRTADVIQNALLSTAMSTFARDFYVASFQLRQRFEEVESVEQAIAVLLSQESFAPALFFNALETAISSLNEKVDKKESV